MYTLINCYSCACVCIFLQISGQHHCRKSVLYGNIFNIEAIKLFCDIAVFFMPVTKVPTYPDNTIALPLSHPFYSVGSWNLFTECKSVFSTEQRLLSRNTRCLD